MSSSTELQEAARAEGKAWVFPDANINSDLLLPNAWTRMTDEADQARIVLEPYRPGWVDEVGEGDAIVAAENFGTGSGRPWARLLYRLGVRIVLADSINDLAYRNCVNAALLAMEVPGISEEVEEGQRVRVDVREGTAAIVETGAQLRGTPMPDMLLEIVAAGGLIQQLTAAGYIS